MRRRPTFATRSRRPAARSVPSAGAASAKRENLKVRTDPEAKAQREFVRKAEKLFMQGLAELHANYAGDKVFAKGAVTSALKGIDALQKAAPLWFEMQKADRICDRLFAVGGGRLIKGEP